MKPQKIFEISGEDWTKGLSFKSDFPVGGVYSVASKFDPFDNYGYFHTSLDYAIVSTTTDTPICITSWNNSGTAKLYVHTATKLYEVLDGSPYTQSDKSAEIDVSPDFRGAIIYKNKYVYSQTTELRANALPVALASDIQILSGYASSEHYHPMCIAPNKKLYIADGNQLNEVTSVAGTTGNTAGKYLLEDNLIVRDLLNDGNYLVVIADSNSSHTATATGVRGKYRSVILFYDVNSGRPTADVIYEFSDSWLTSVKQLDGALYIFGKDNLYICNAATPPKAIFSFDGDSTITEAPRTPFEVIVKGNSILWSGQNNGVIWAYGSLVSGQKKVFYQPYSAGGTPRALVWTGTNLYAGGSATNQMLYVFNTGSTRTTSSVTTAPIFLPSAYRYAYSKVIMKKKLTSGGEVYLGLNSLDGSGIISDQITKQYSTVGAKQTVVFGKENDSGQASERIFSDFTLTVGSNQEVARVEVYGYPVDNYEQSN